MGGIFFVRVEMKPKKYPLEQVIDVKKDRVNKAEKLVNEKKKALEIEEEKLEKVKKERDKVLNHHNEKLSQLRREMDSGTTSDEILQMKAYLKVVKENLAKEEVKVKKQQEAVKTAEDQLEAAKEELKRRRIELEKMLLHKEEWKKGMVKEVERELIKFEDELGTTSHTKEQRKRKDLK